MIGDKLVITDYHRAAATKVVNALGPGLSGDRPVAVTVAGESGSGKSEIARCLHDALVAEGYRCVILGQDDYFVLPPKTNHRRRLEDLGWVGTGEVRLDLLDEHVAALKTDRSKALEKPLVYFDEDRIGTEMLPRERPDVIIVEGTYVTLLENVDVRAFINRTYHQTKRARLLRARDSDMEFLERVLEIEHAEISTHRARADVVIDPPAGDGPAE